MLLNRFSYQSRCTLFKHGVQDCFSGVYSYVSFLWKIISINKLSSLKMFYKKDGAKIKSAFPKFSEKLNFPFLDKEA